MYGGHMKLLDNYACQNTVITPLGSGPELLLVLTGIVVADFPGISDEQARHEMLRINPDLSETLLWAINQFNIPWPGGPIISTQFHIPKFQVQQWAPFASLSSIVNQGTSG